MAAPFTPSHRRNITFINSIFGTALKIPPPHTRAIDLVDGRRDTPLKVLCLGYSRTGTLSMYTALRMLGYAPYHMAEAIKNADVDMKCWVEAIEAKHLGKGKKWGREEFDKITGRFDALLDIPCVLFVEEMIAAYPDAKVILTERPVEDWLKSMRNSIGEVFSWRRWKYVAWADRDLAWPLWRLIGRTLTDLYWDRGNFSPESKTAQHYLEHNELVRKVCPPEKLLEFKLGSGWEPLCEFLGKEVPEGTYPNVNDGEMFVMAHQAILDRATWWAVRKVLGWSVLVGVLVGAVWWWLKLRL